MSQTQIWGILKGGTWKCLMQQVGVLQMFQIVDNFSSARSPHPLPTQPKSFCERSLRSLLDMQCMLLGYSFEPGPNTRALSTVGSVTIGLSINRCSHSKNQFDERKRDWLVQKFGLRRLSKLDAIQADGASFSPPTLIKETTNGSSAHKVLISVVDPPGAPSLNFRAMWGPKGQKKKLGDWGPPSNLRVWMTASPPHSAYLKVWIRPWF